MPSSGCRSRDGRLHCGERHGEFTALTAEPSGQWRGPAANAEHHLVDLSRVRPDCGEHMMHATLGKVQGMPCGTCTRPRALQGGRCRPLSGESRTPSRPHAPSAAIDGATRDRSIGRERECVILLQDLLQSCSRGGRRRVEDMCYESRDDAPGLCG